MRIISGTAKGKKLLSPEGMGTRPTLDRVKEAMFNIIQHRISDSVVLDMFAGTGSLGLESASRGAKECYLVDKGDITYGYLKQNIENLKFQDFCHSFNMDSYDALEYLFKKGLTFDIIFIDPPYLKDMIPPAVEIITAKHLLKKDGIIVTKIDTKEILFEGNGEIVLTDSRKYGNTTIAFYKYKED